MDKIRAFTDGSVSIAIFNLTLDDGKPFANLKPGLAKINLTVLSILMKIRIYMWRLISINLF